MNKQLLPKDLDFFNPLSEKFPNSELFLVGGAVRDALLERPSKDYDFVVRGVEIEKLIKFFETLGDVNLVGKRFGVLKFKPSGSKQTYDIALPRREFSRSFSGAYRDFEIQSNHELPIEEDLSRRDFTINAMAYNVITQELVDPFFGQKDLAAKKIRTVGAAVSRFQEDYSRMLRAIRFACQLDFSLSEKIVASIKKLAFHLNDKIDDHWVVAREVISKEFLKALDAAPVKCIKLLDELKILEIILPEIKELQEAKQSPPYHLEGNVYKHSILALKNLQSKEFKKYFKEEPNLLTKLAALFHDLGKPKVSSQDKNGIHFYGHAKVGAEMVAKICSRLALGSSAYYPFQCKKLTWLVKNHLFSIEVDYKNIKATKLEELFFSDRWPSQSLLQVMLADQLASLSAKKIDSAAPFKKLMKELQKLAPGGKLPPPLATGKEVLKWTRIKEGPQVKAIMLDLREEQLQKRIKTKAQAKAYIIKKHGNE